MLSDKNGERVCVRWLGKGKMIPTEVKTKRKTLVEDPGEGGSRVLISELKRRYDSWPNISPIEGKKWKGRIGDAKGKGRDFLPGGWKRELKLNG